MAASDSLTFIFLKPDTLERDLVYQVMSYFSKAGIGARVFDVRRVTAEAICKHYAAHIEKYGESFRRQTLDMFEGKYIVPALLESGGADLIARVRGIVGATEPAKAAPGTIRGDLGLGDCYARSVPENRLVRNLIHASDTPEAVKRETAIWLPDFPF